MTSTIAELETHRLELQARLDAGKEKSARNKMGQFATPPGLALDLLGYAKTQLGKGERVRFLDPAFGTGSFYSALLDVMPRPRIDAAVGYEVDRHYGEGAADLWQGTGLDLRLGDFTRAECPDEAGRFNLLICNPPYVRHHHIPGSEKQRLRSRTHEASGIEIGGLAGLYCHFLGLSHAWMADGALAGWLIPSEFMNVNYGASIRDYLISKVTLMHIHRFDPNDVQFGDALVSSAVVWLRKQAPPPGHEVRFTYGGTLKRPKVERWVSLETLRSESKWTRYPALEDRGVASGPVLGDFFEIKRGLVTGCNDFFILPGEDIERRGLPKEVFRPILPSPRYLPTDEVVADEEGNPVLERRLFLLDCRREEDWIRRRHPRLWAYLEEGLAQGIGKGYLCRNRRPWYVQENRPPAPFVCTYLGRSDAKSGHPFRFILNDSQATAANVYLMLYPRQSLKQVLEQRADIKRKLWRCLNETCPQALLDEGRVYGGGLHKLEPKELGNVSARAIAELLSAELPNSGQAGVQGKLFPGLVA